MSCSEMIYPAGSFTGYRCNRPEVGDPIGPEQPQGHHL